MHVVESPWADERRQAAGAFLAGVAPAAEVLLVGASRDAADELARETAAARGATFGVHRASMVELAVRLALGELARRGVATANRLGTEALAARVSFEALRAGQLGYFASVARFPGFARALAVTLVELRLAGVAPAALERLGGPGRDMAELVRRFETQLDDGKLADRALLLAVAAGVIAHGGSHPLLGLPTVLLDVPVATPAERAFLGAVTARCPAVLATVPSGDDPTRRALHAIAAARPRAPWTPSALAVDRSGDERRAGDGRSGDPSDVRPGVAIAGSDAVPRAAESGGADGETDLVRLRTRLFAPAAPTPRAASGDVVFFSAPGEAREAVEIVRRILEAARDGTRFDDIAVLLRAPEVYAVLLETALRRAGVPAWFARGTSRPDPAGRAFLALLDCALEGLSARRFAEYLSLGQVPPLDSAGAPPADRSVWTAPDDEELMATATPAAAADAIQERVAEDTSGAPPVGGDDQPLLDGTLRAPWKWEQLLVESTVIGGRERWSRRLAGLEAEYRTRLLRLREEDPDSHRAAGVERDLRNLEHLRRFAVPVIEQLAVLPASGPGRAWGDWIAALEALAPQVLRRPARVLTVLAALRPLDVIGPITLGEVRDVLAGELIAVAERPPADRYGRVFVGTIEQARGRSFSVVFVPGLAERVFPRKLREDPMLLDAARRALSADLATQDERSEHERLLLRLAAGAARRRLYFSYARIEQTEARPRVPSFYALEVARALTGRVPEPQAMERAAAAAGGARLAWPAPEDPARAIDEVEHDLAALRLLLPSGAVARGHTGPARETSRGRARYLLELNDALARSLRTRWARWHRKWTPADGLVRVTDGTREPLAGARLAARAYSASALQKFAACPYQFFLSAICRLAPREEVAAIVELDPLTRGHLFHRVQADAMRALAREGQLPLRPGALEGAQATLDRVLDEVAAQYREELAPAIARVWQDEVESMRADLRLWLEQSATAHAAWKPIAFELAFGLPADPANDPRSVAAEVTLPEGFRLRGIIDLVERQRAGTDLRVTDYKTGVNFHRRPLVVGGGEMLQPVLYGLAAEQVLGARVEASRLYYCTRAGGFSERLVPMSEEARARGLEVLTVIDRAVAAGFLAAAPRPRACGICDFRDVCGPHEELRAAQKDRTALEDLRALRELP